MPGKLVLTRMNVCSAIGAKQFVKYLSLMASHNTIYNIFTSIHVMKEMSSKAQSRLRNALHEKNYKIHSQQLENEEIFVSVSSLHICVVAQKHYIISTEMYFHVHFPISEGKKYQERKYFSSHMKNF